jgi:hypothetical protein
MERLPQGIFVSTVLPFPLLHHLFNKMPGNKMCDFSASVPVKDTKHCGTFIAFHLSLCQMRIFHIPAPTLHCGYSISETPVLPILPILLGHWTTEIRPHHVSISRR